MTDVHTKQLVASEIGGLWTTYLSDSMLECVYSYFTAKVEDPDIKKIIDRTLEIAIKHKAEKMIIFQKEGHVEPLGFTNADVHVDAPKLYTDEFLLHYTKQALQGAIGSYNATIPHIFREDIRDHFLTCIDDALKLYDEMTDLMMKKGIAITPPSIPHLKELDMVEKKRFFDGWFGEERPLTAIEITELYANILSNDVGVALLKGFSQCAKKEEVRNFFNDGKERGQEQIKRLSKYLQKNDLPIPLSTKTQVLDSTDSPFSDKLMMSQIATLSASSIGYYGLALSMCSRSDLIKEFTKLLSEAAFYAGKGSSLLVKHGWLEKPPHAPHNQQ
ncbi:DUF3231 family protein [Paenibacillus alvei]